MLYGFVWFLVFDCMEYWRSLQEKLAKLIIDSTAWKNVWFISLLVTNVENNVQVKQLILLTIGAIITGLTLVHMHKAYLACRNTIMNIFVIVNIVVFLMMSHWQDWQHWQDWAYQSSSKRKLLEAYLENIYTIRPKYQRQFVAVYCWFWSRLHELVLFAYSCLSL